MGGSVLAHASSGTGRVIPPYERTGTSAKGPWSRFTGCSPAAVSSSVATGAHP
ncbi:hypothetical protein HMPREF0321_1275 [Dermacoccus sp. Ellin185]|nr:hypothetical protein HMPREF0321_1275 [Dermacoccus sp. Ellin185]